MSVSLTWRRKLRKDDVVSDEVARGVAETVDCLWPKSTWPEPYYGSVQYVVARGAVNEVLGGVVHAPVGDWWCADDDICGPHESSREARDCLVHRLGQARPELQGIEWQRARRRQPRPFVPFVPGFRLRSSALAEETTFETCSL